MKELYSFHTERTIEKEVPHVKKTKDGPVETTKKVKKKIKNRIVFAKPSILDLEDAEFFFGQKYNEYINAGFLTKAMLSKKMGDIGGLASKTLEEGMNQAVVDNMEASRTIAFFEGAKDLNDAQKEQLSEAKELFASTKARLHDYEVNIRSQFSQTADAKAEIKVIEWLVLKFSFFEQEIEKKKELFPVFEGDDYEQKRLNLISLQEPSDSQLEDPIFVRSKKIYDDCYDQLIRIASIWYNKLGDDQKSIDQAIKDLFSDEEKESDEG
jgi:hypothetical protein